MSPWQWAWFIPVVIIAVVFALAPLLGLVAVSGGGRFATAAAERPLAETAPFAGVFFLCAVVALVVLIVLWIVRGKPGVARGFGLYTFVFASLTLAGLLLRGPEESVNMVWSIPVAIAAGLGGVLTVLLFVDWVRRLRADAARKPGDPPVLSPQAAALKEQLQSRLAHLSGSERDAVKSDLDAAIQDLEQRGLITPAEAERAHSTELGGLAIRMGSSSATSRSR
ncbi:hypothetical protein [Homoserinimonas hongtaonis]|uniref:Uncharacterized protein n=1 Tax=Homoserinimonas hongtaonis TaxID=2079791 RepID=A0A2U1T0U1_9MICO|nr:hypothetical protein [Salinibacterium hongtaonis]PWB97478.1 hypothetical protein DF220_06270 [Salinibacterium hongtaonis]